MRYETYKRNVPYFDDAAHGWILVSLAELASLNITEKITEYSYVSENCDGSVWVYLEEDCDASTYLKALEARGIQYEIQHAKYHGDHSWIRNLKPYKNAV